MVPGDELEEFIRKIITVIMVIAAIVVTLLLGVAFGINSARAHTSISGWTLPKDCCRDHQDCQMIDPRYIHFEAARIRVELPPGVHRHAPKGIRHLFDYTSGAVRPSGDGYTYACVGLSTHQLPPGGGNKPVMRCIYIVPGGV